MKWAWEHGKTSFSRSTLPDIISVFITVMVSQLKINLKANFTVFKTMCATTWLELSDGMRNKSAHHIVASIFTRTLLECFLPPVCAFCLISSLSTLCSRSVVVFSRAFICLLYPCMSVCSNQWHFTLTSQSFLLTNEAKSPENDKLNLR